MITLAIAKRWDGTALPAAERASVQLSNEAEHLLIEVDSPWFSDPAPPGLPGPTDHLWEHEVVEVFLADDAEHYLEVELGPHGHHLVIELRGVRRPVRDKLPIDYTVSRDHVRFRGVARVPRTYLPSRVCRANAFAIHGPATQRCHHAHASIPAAAPDFHRLQCFVPVELG